MLVTVLFSNNGKLIPPSAHLRDIDDGTGPGNDRDRVRIPSTAYEPVRHGSAVSAYFLRAFHPAIKSDIDKNDQARFMLLSQIRPMHAIQQPPVLINYHEDLTGKPYKDIPSDGVLDIDFSGAAYYGNRMFFYQNAFKESEFNVTLKWTAGGDVAEQISSKAEVQNEGISGAISAFGKVPFLSGFAPYFAGADVALDLFKKLKGLINDDSGTTVLTKADLSLFLSRPHLPILRSGRYVLCDANVDEVVSRYRLAENNYLEAVNEAGVVPGFPYIVIAIDGKHQPAYQNFDRAASFAEFAQQATSKNPDHPRLAATIESASEAFRKVDLLRDLATARGLDRERLLEELPDDLAWIKGAINNNAS